MPKVQQLFEACRAVFPPGAAPTADASPDSLGFQLLKAVLDSMTPQDVGLDDGAMPCPLPRRTQGTPLAAHPLLGALSSAQAPSTQGTGLPSLLLRKAGNASNSTTVSTDTKDNCSDDSNYSAVVSNHLRAGYTGSSTPPTLVSEPRVRLSGATECTGATAATVGTVGSGSGASRAGQGSHPAAPPGPGLRGWDNDSTTHHRPSPPAREADESSGLGEVIDAGEETGAWDLGCDSTSGQRQGIGRGTEGLLSAVWQQPWQGTAPGLRPLAPSQSLPASAEGPTGTAVGEASSHLLRRRQADVTRRPHRPSPLGNRQSLPMPLFPSPPLQGHSHEMRGPLPALEYTQSLPTPPCVPFSDGRSGRGSNAGDACGSGNALVGAGKCSLWPGVSPSGGLPNEAASAGTGLCRQKKRVHRRDPCTGGDPREVPDLNTEAVHSTARDTSAGAGHGAAGGPSTVTVHSASRDTGAIAEHTGPRPIRAHDGARKSWPSGRPLEDMEGTAVHGTYGRASRAALEDLLLFRAVPAPVAPFRPPPITYLHVYSCPEFSIGIFCLPRFARIPLHDHPGMTVLSRLLVGTMHVRAFDWEPGTSTSAPDSADVSGMLGNWGAPAACGDLEGNPLGVGVPVTSNDTVCPATVCAVTEFSPAGSPADVLGGGHNARLARLVEDTMMSAPGSPSEILFPSSGGNIHAFTALTPCAVLDVLAPPYDVAQGRSCTYYREADAGAPQSHGRVCEPLCVRGVRGRGKARRRCVGGVPQGGEGERGGEACRALLRKQTLAEALGEHPHEGRLGQGQGQGQMLREALEEAQEPKGQGQRKAPLQLPLQGRAPARGTSVFGTKRGRGAQDGVLAAQEEGEGAVTHSHSQSHSQPQPQSHSLLQLRPQIQSQPQSHSAPCNVPYSDMYRQQYSDTEIYSEPCTDTGPGALSLGATRVLETFQPPEDFVVSRGTYCGPKVIDRRAKVPASLCSQLASGSGALRVGSRGERRPSATPQGQF